MLQRAFVVVLTLSGIARAEDAPRDEAAEARSRALFHASLSARSAGELPRALCLMHAAQDAAPHTAFLFNIAQLQRELGLCAQASASYRAYLERETDPELRRAAEQARAGLATCPTSTAVAETSPADCARWVSSVVPSAVSEANTPRAPAPTPAGASQPQAARAPVAPPAPTVDSSSTLQTALAWGLLGTSVLLGSLAVYEGTQMVAAEREINGAWAWDDQLAERVEEGQNAETLTWAFGVSSAVSLAGAVLLFVLSPASATETSHTAGQPATLRLRF